MPIIRRLAESEHYEPLVVSTGQHQRMVAYIFELAGIKPDVVLWAGSKRSQLNERVASVMRRFEDFCAERFEAHPDGTADAEDILNGRFPAAVLVHGDTTSAMSAALSAFHLRIPVMHVEAGLRTGGNNLTPFPEELNRQLISCIAGLHFAPTAKNLENLIRENIPIGQIFVTGNTGIDALQWASTIDVQFANPRLQELHESDRRIVVITAHRRENWGAGLTGIAEGVRAARRRRAAGAFRPAATPQSARARDALQPPRRSRKRALDRAAGLCDLRPAAGANHAGDHRFGWDSGGGSVARQAGAGGTRDDRARPRASKPARCGWWATIPTGSSRRAIGC